MGDVKYGAPQSFKLRDIALHSLSLTISHPISKIEVEKKLQQYRDISLFLYCLPCLVLSCLVSSRPVSSRLVLSCLADKTRLFIYHKRKCRPVKSSPSSQAKRLTASFFLLIYSLHSFPLSYLHNIRTL